MKIALLGAGRVADCHAKNIYTHPETELYSVSDVIEASAQKLASRYGAKVLSVDEAISDPAVDVVLIATSTDTHADLSLQAAKAGKAIFCEKPIDLDSAKVKKVIAEIKATGVPFMVGFNRRFDPQHGGLKKAILAGAIGDVEHVEINSRDPAPASAEYIKASGGLFKDMMIHDFDMARFQLGEDPILISAMGSSIISEDIKAAGDIDVAVVTLKTASGKIAVINNSRRSGYGYDQRIDVHGSKGCIRNQNVTEDDLITITDAGLSAAKPLLFFLERYEAAFKYQWDAFVEALVTKSPIPSTMEDGLKALLLAEAAEVALKTQKAVHIDLSA